MQGGDRLFYYIEGGSASKAGAVSQPEWWLKKATEGPRWSGRRRIAETLAAVLLELCTDGRRLVKKCHTGLTDVFTAERERETDEAAHPQLCVTMPL